MLCLVIFAVRAECYVNAVDQSQTVLAVISPDMIHHEWCEFALHYTITIAKRDVVYLMYRPLSTNSWNEYQKALKAANRLGKKVKWPKNETTGNLRHFWAKLRYYLPPPRKIVPSDSNSVSFTNTNGHIKHEPKTNV